MEEDDTSLADADLNLYEAILHKIHNLAADTKHSMIWLDKDMYDSYAIFEANPKYQKEPECYLIWKVLEDTYRGLHGNREDEVFRKFMSCEPTPEESLIPKPINGFGKSLKAKTHIPRGYIYISVILQAAKHYKFRRTFSNDLKRHELRIQERHKKKEAEMNLRFESAIEALKQTHTDQIQKLKVGYMQDIGSSKRDHSHRIRDVRMQQNPLPSSSKVLPLGPRDNYHDQPAFGFSEDGTPRYSVEITGLGKGMRFKESGAEWVCNALDVFLRTYDLPALGRKFILIEPLHDRNTPSAAAVGKCQEALDIAKLWLAFDNSDKHDSSKYLIGFVGRFLSSGKKKRVTLENFALKNIASAMQSQNNSTATPSLFPFRSRKKRKFGDDTTADVPRYSHISLEREISVATTESWPTPIQQKKFDDLPQSNHTTSGLNNVETKRSDKRNGTPPRSPKKAISEDVTKSHRLGPSHILSHDEDIAGDIDEVGSFLAKVAGEIDEKRKCTKKE
ncbi:hypothetical protein DID88_005479 [Monilinia fructigena]|uniref:Uncharacterized protein n=1 Tax=Monilinia fructigena TaxID=38457 RepID=A0A395J0Q8_9HELO|nr:hypothetical protein DID88_005479 [Monilinia fructigena]